MRYILNNYYLLHHDKGRTFILGGRNGRKPYELSVDEDWLSIIHPAYAMMLSFFSNPIEIDDAINAITDFFKLPKDKIMEFVTHLTTATECWHTNLGGFESGFPKNLIIPENCHYGNIIEYKPEFFQFNKLDFQTKRMLSVPLSIVWMPNNNCYTACKYCYADRSRHNYVFSLDNIEKFVKEASSSGVVEILLTGGDFFENPHWKEILDVLYREGYNINMISTKKPLTNKELIDFKHYGIILQVSLDTLSEDTASVLLHVNSGYVSRIKEMLRNANDLGISFQVATVLTNINDSISNLESLYQFLNGFDKLIRWNIRVAFRSLYTKSDFDAIKCSRSSINRVADWVAEIQNEAAINISWSPDDDNKYMKAKGGSRNFEGARCSANLSNMVVLPDGNVTICEQLYWNPEFIIGNVFSDTISSIWNSDKAIGLWKKEQEAINKDSPCSRCSDFADCYSNGNRCITNIIKAYGAENSDYPDPRCYLAPPFKINITHE